MKNNPHRNAVEIERISQISKNEFYQQYIRTQTPVVITNQMDSWPAMKKWSFEFMAEMEATVCIEQGNVLQGETKFKETDLRAYITELLKQSNCHEHNQTEYLSVFNIFAVFPHLKEDVDFSLLADYKRRNVLSGWIGPAGTVTSYHIDWADNLFAQIVGHKRFHFVLPEQGKYMYPGSKYDGGSKISLVDPLNYDADRFPNFAKAKVLTTTLGPGELLYNPRGWWHHVESLDKSISVNNFGLDLKGLLIDRTTEKLKQRLHKMGLYGRDCTCHMVVNGERVSR